MSSGSLDDKQGDNRSVSQSAGTSHDQAEDSNSTHQRMSSTQEPQVSNNQAENKQGDSALWGQSNTAQVQDQPGKRAASPGQESGTAWQESQQMGKTGMEAEQNPAQG